MTAACLALALLLAVAELVAHYRLTLTYQEVHHVH